MVQKLHICKKVYFDPLLDFQISLLLFLHTLLLCHILLLGCWIVSVPSGSKLFAKLISRQQKSSLAGKELYTKQLVDTTFWLDLGLTKFHLAPIFPFG